MLNSMQWIQPVDQIYYGRTRRRASQKEKQDKPERCIVHPKFSDGDVDGNEFGSCNRDARLDSRKEDSSFSSYEGPHVTRAPSECSSLNDSKIESSETNSCTSQALWLEKELAIRRWKRNCAKRKEAGLMFHALLAAYNFMQEKHKMSEDVKKAGNGEKFSWQEVLDVPHQELQPNLKCLDVGFDANDSVALESLSRVEKLQRFSGNLSQTQNEAGQLWHSSENETILHRCLEKLQEDLKRSEMAFYVNNDFTREALRKLEQLRSFSLRPNEVLCNQDDPAQALQEKLENLLLTIHSLSSFEGKEKESKILLENHEHLAEKKTDSILTNEDTSRTESLFLDEENPTFEIAALKRQLDLLSSELKETNNITGLLQKQYRPLLGRNQTRRRRQTCKGYALALEASRKDLVAEEVECKTAIRKIAAQVQAETEQWSRMQEILQHVKDELEEVYRDRDLWEERALHAEAHLISLQEAAYEWKVRARGAEEHVRALQCELSKLQNKVERAKYRHALEKKQRSSVESWLKDALASPLLFKKSSECRVEDKQEQKLDDSVRRSHEDWNEQHDCDENRHIWTLDHLNASKSHHANRALRQSCHSGEYRTVLHKQHEVFASGECINCGKKPIINTYINKKVGQVKENNLVTTKNNRKENKQSGAESSMEKEDECCVSRSIQRLPFVEINNLGPSSTFKSTLSDHNG